MSSKPDDKYPAARNSSETERLHKQHEVVKSAFGPSFSVQLTLSKSGLRIFDSGTACGYFLHDLGSQLAHPDSAELIGTDIVDYPDTIGLPKAIKLYKQNILEDWPKDREATFDSCINEL
jgi:hypothetical protein